MLKEFGGALVGLFRSSPEKQAREFHKDVLEIIDMAQVTYRDDLNQQIAALTSQSIEQIDNHCGNDKDCHAHESERYKILHREARRQASQVKLTAYTLIIIHTRSLALAELGEPVRAAIEEYCARWPNPDPDKAERDASTLVG